MESELRPSVPGALVRSQILEYIHQGRLIFDPQLDIFQIRMHAIDLRLGYCFKISQEWKMTDRGREAVGGSEHGRDQEFYPIELEEGQFFDLLPGETVDVDSLEEMTIPDDVYGTLFPRTKIHRQRVHVALTGIIDAGYTGKLHIPVTNISNRVKRLFPGERFCQIVLSSLSQPVQVELSRWHKVDTAISHQNERSSEEENLVLLGKIRELKKRFAIPDPNGNT